MMPLGGLSRYLLCSGGLQGRFFVPSETCLGIGHLFWLQACVLCLWTEFRMQECAPVLEPCSQGEKSRNAVGPGKSARHTNAINPEAMGSWGWFSFSSSKVNQGKEVLVWNSLDM